jgi:RNA polymerase sigma factor (sigma-70 family)
MTPLLSSSLLRGQTDERLVELARNGHDRAFEAIVERYRRPLLRYLRRLLSDTLAEDVVQATFINAWSSMRTGTEVRELRPWLYRIAHNAAINALKKVGEAMEEVPESVGGFATEPATELERRDEMQRALTSIAALPSRQRTALLAVAIDGRAHSDVAEELGLTDGAVRQLVHRARTTLRGGVTAITPMPLLYMFLASSGDATVARVAEVAAGAGGAGAASVSLKAGAAAILATGALITTGPQIAHVVQPADKPAAATRASAPTTTASRPARASTGAAATPAVATPAAVAPLVPPAATSSAKPSSSSTSDHSGRSHHQRRRGSDHRSGSSSDHHSGSGRDDRASHHGGEGESGSGSGTSRGSGGSGRDDGGGESSSGSGSSGSGRGGGDDNEAATVTGTREGSGSGDDGNAVTKKRTGRAKRGGSKRHGGGGHGGGDGSGGLVATPAAPAASDDGGGHDATPSAPATSAPQPTTPDETTGEVRTAPSGGDGGGGGG